jgi:Helicase associated domain
MLTNHSSFLFLYIHFFGCLSVPTPNPLSGNPQESHGHVMVPRQCEYPGLGDWVTSQRQQYQEYVLGKPTPLSRQRKEMLDALGFQWRVRNRPEWATKYAELVQYKETIGDTVCPLFPCCRCCCRRRQWR